MNREPTEAEREANVAKLLAERAKLDAEERKLKSDNEVVGRQLQNYWRLQWLSAAAGLGGITTAVVAIVALGISAIQFSSQQQQRHADAEAASLQQALVLASDASSAGTEKRLIGVTILASFADPKQAPENRDRALIALSNLLALENDGTVRGAIVDALGSVKPDAVGTSSLNNLLASLAAKSRILARNSADKSDPAFPEFTSAPQAEIKARGVAEAIVAVVRSGARIHDLSGIYCPGCDFSDLHDLSGTLFDDAVLSGASFKNSSLAGASFSRAQLDGASFEHAGLDRAVFRVDGAAEDRVAHREARRLADPTQAVQWPDFTCASLRQADFHGFTIMAATNLPQALQPPQWTAFPSFSGADLTGAVFGDNAVLVFSEQSLQSPFEFIRRNETPEIADRRRFLITRYVLHPIKQGTATGTFPPYIDSAQIAFSGATWRGAKGLPTAIVAMLNAKALIQAGSSCGQPGPSTAAPSVSPSAVPRP